MATKNHKKAQKEVYEDVLTHCALGSSDIRVNSCPFVVCLFPFLSQCHRLHLRASAKSAVPFSDAATAPIS